MKLLKLFIENELKLDPAYYLKKFTEYEKILLEWNGKINLISRKSDSIEEHVLNSVFLLTKFDLSNILNIADIGTGGGFPGIPLKIFFPEMNMLLVDSIKKKIVALNDIIKKMNLKKILTACGRAEEISREDIFKNKYDVVISKSVSSLDRIYKWSHDFLGTGGLLLCIKGGDIDNEIESLKKMKYNLHIQVVNFDYEHYGIIDKKLVIIKSPFN